MNARPYLAAALILISAPGVCAGVPYVIVGTGQVKQYDDRREIAPPSPGQPFFGQDAHFPGVEPSYALSADG